jgi:hypothetical protein
MFNDRDEAEFRSDELIRMAALVMEPLHGKDIPPPRVTAADLIHLAQQQRRPVVRIPWRWLGAPALVGAIVLMVLSVANFLPVADRRNTGPNRIGPAEPQPLQLPYAVAVPPARQRLLTLAAGLNGSHDTLTVGRYTYVHTRTWSRDTTAGVPHPPTVCRDERLWWAPDGSGRQVITELPGLCAAPTDAGTATDYRPGEIKVVVPTPSADPPILASQLADHEDFSTGPQAVLRAVCELYRYHALDAEHRVAALRVLASTSGLAYRGIVVDAAGRRGVAITVDSDSGGTRDVAVFAPATGQLLAYERVFLRSPIRAALVTPAVSDSVLFLTAERVERLG